MSVQEQIEELEVDEGELTAEKIVDQIARDTIPGRSNQPFIEGLENAPEIVQDVLGDLNNWVEIMDVRIYSTEEMGIPCRYRWSIIRWTENDMDTWLEDHGWEHMPHLRADSRNRNPNDLEARYRKQFDDVMVNINVHVEIPEVVFDALEGKSGSVVERRKVKSRRRMILANRRS